MPTTSAENTLPLQVHDVGFLLDRLGEDCHPLQFLRELTQNAIEAISKTPEKTGQIIWDVDWPSLDLGDHPTYKLSITDTGCGMTGEEMRQYINHLSSSGTIQASDGNYGVGAKVAAATRNHAGLIYLSWKSGKGSMIHLWRNPGTKQYGLRQIQRPDGTFGHWADLDDLVKPEVIGEHGTKIILFGNSPEQDTMKAPAEAASPSAWIAKYLNSRYFQIPDGVTIRARQGWEQPRTNTDVNLLRTLLGQNVYLEQHKGSSGTIELAGARVHWWILKDESAIGSNSGFIESSGHVAALYQNELYELVGGRAGQARLQQFGVIFGHRQVVIYVEPTPPEGARLTTNTARTELLLNSQRLPWADWAAEFREKLPRAIASLMEEIASRASDTDHSKSIRDRLKAMMELFKVSRYKPTQSGPLQIAEPAANTGGRLPRGDGGPGKGGIGGSKVSGGGAVGGIYSAFLKADGQSGSEARPDLFPKVVWVSVKDGTRETGEIEDKAARYLEEQHVLKINADFRVFVDMIDHWLDIYTKEQGPLAGLREAVRDSVHSWYEQALTETIIGLQALRGSKEWPTNQLQDAWSESALSAVVMQRYHPFNSIKRELGTKIAPLKK
ncbi:MAG: ATP-binding protein [Acidobacteriia bacterium]|nr:ATP-binding protein [Terriglobia bacterium]